MIPKIGLIISLLGEKKTIKIVLLPHPCYMSIKEERGWGWGEETMASFSLMIIMIEGTAMGVLTETTIERSRPLIK